MKKKLKFLIAGMCFLFAQNILAQEQLVTGTVTDAESGMPLPGVTIVEKGTDNGTITDFDGNYSIEVPSSAVLVFSMVGYASEDHPVGADTTLDVVLSVNIEA
ncbi:MAG TPA: carboxypeptidase-like regulatory domain-containing protein, partial [Salinimicrobium sp.]|nr:carboxypeptidase-like regulatory domain-containing protein [Salinimicrobium sp.]